MKGLTIGMSKVREVRPDSYEALTEVLFGYLDPGFYRIFEGWLIDLRAFPATPESFAGFPCPVCKSSVRTDHRLQGFPDLHLYACACTGLIIRPPYGPLKQWHWSAFTAARASAPVRLSSGGAGRNALILGICDSEQHS